jgi:hypothetical protein
MTKSMLIATSLAAAAALALVAGTAGAADPFNSDDKLIFHAAQLCVQVAFENYPAVANPNSSRSARSRPAIDRLTAPREISLKTILRLCSQTNDYSGCASDLSYDK